MASDYRGLYSTHILHSDSVPQPPCFDGNELGRVQHQHLRHDEQWLIQSHDLHGAIQREIEKERIRQEIIMSAILTRPALEAEVRRDLMMIETSVQRGSNLFPFGCPSRMGLDLSMRLPLAETMVEERFLDKRSMLLTPRHILNNMCEGGRSESLPFQRASTDMRTGRDSMAKESDVNKKNEIILEAKPIKNITGAKRASPGSGVNETQSDANLKKQKRVEEKWSCTLCQVTATSEHILNEHLKGKKHKTKEAALKVHKSRIEICTKQAAKPIRSSGTSDQVREVKLTPKSFTDGPPPPLQGNPNSDNLKKEELVLTQGQQKGEHKKETYKFWCELCQVGVLSEKVMKMHQQGKKHKRRLLQNQVVEKTVADELTAVKKSQQANAVCYGKFVLV
ncbi:hypothetical protein AAHA92_17109 [Salvia divinorum]|uniref:U1-type domain-containing protein n=1 Tax=Salvia divinorum TaxID=28513 RepID=A0ABD1H1R7_SALDI